MKEKIKRYRIEQDLGAVYVLVKESDLITLENKASDGPIETKKVSVCEIIGCSGVDNDCQNNPNCEIIQKLYTTIPSAPSEEKEE